MSSAHASCSDPEQTTQTYLARKILIWFVVAATHVGTVIVSIYYPVDITEHHTVDNEHQLEDGSVQDTDTGYLVVGHMQNSCPS